MVKKRGGMKTLTALLSAAIFSISPVVGGIGKAFAGTDNTDKIVLSKTRADICSMLVLVMSRCFWNGVDKKDCEVTSENYAFLIKKLTGRGDNDEIIKMGKGLCHIICKEAMEGSIKNGLDLVSSFAEGCLGFGEKKK